MYFFAMEFLMNTSFWITSSKDTSKDSKGILQTDSKDTTGHLQRRNETHKGHQENVKNTKGANQSV